MQIRSKADTVFFGRLGPEDSPNSFLATDGKDFMSKRAVCVACMLLCVLCYVCCVCVCCVCVCVVCV